MQRAGGKFFHSAHATFAYYIIAPGASVHAHSQDQEEVWHIPERALDVSPAGSTTVLRSGQARHAARSSAANSSSGGVPRRP